MTTYEKEREKDKDKDKEIDKETFQKKNKNFCGNCGKYGHIYSKCKEPTTSLGIINIKLEDNQGTRAMIDKFKEYTIDTNGKKDIITPLNDNIDSDNIELFCKYKDTVKFLLIRRKNTLGYIEFIRGRYEVNDIDGIIALFEQMITEEIENIKNHELKFLWNNLWSSSPSNEMQNYYEYEFKQSEEKFNKLKYDNMSANLFFYTKHIRSKYDNPEWGFPKGRRNYHEKNLDCAKREFMEESGYDNFDYLVLKKLHSLNEVFNGTNGVKYKHIYYIGLMVSDNEPTIDYSKPSQCDEIGEIGWFTYDDAIKLIRPHHKQRKIILTQLYMFIVNELIKL
jgi:8-oxo-dGTP pyrophosphatase MutT (NUDIX family)